MKRLLQIPKRLSKWLSICLGEKDGDPNRRRPVNSKLYLDLGRWRVPMKKISYQAPKIEKIVKADDFERESVYGGAASTT